MELSLTFGSLLSIALWELLRPRRRREFPALRRRLGNLGIWLLNTTAFGFVLIVAAPDAIRSQFGITTPSWPIADPWLSFVAAFMLLDFLVYAVHRCQHAIPWLWHFHALHHSDPDVDVTTAVRHHPLEHFIAGRPCCTDRSFGGEEWTV